jgi:sugar phosphate isomerase/epimerase
MTTPIALQLYSVREDLKRDFAGGIRRIAAMGYAGVEPAGFPGTTCEDAAVLFRTLDLRVPSVHVPMPVGENRQKSIETAIALGGACMVSGLGADHYRTLDDIKRSCDTFNAAGTAARENGLRFGIHNHWWEFLEVDGRIAYDILLERLDPAVLLELDTYWAQTAGQDPATVVKRLGARAPLLHIKDGPCERGVPMTAVGEGKVDVPKIMANASGTEWLIVELDSCATDMMEAVEKSLRYLVDSGLARRR